MTNVTCKIDPKDFARGVRQAKSLGGTFDARTKLWTIGYDETTRDFDPRRYGMIEVSRVVVSQRETLADLGAEAAIGDDGMDRIDV